MKLSTKEKTVLLDIARRSIIEGLEQGKPVTDLGELSAQLMQPGASFVTLETHHQLRGCIGSLEAYRPLAEDVAQNAYGAAFRDTRFPPLQAQELAGLSIQVSVLTPTTPIPYESEADLLRKLVPGVDGILLEDGVHRATFLPQVWEQLPTPEEFMSHLKSKAGLPSHYWNPSLRIYRYHVEKFG